MTEQLVETVVWEGAEALRPFLVPIDSLADHEKNARRGDVEALKGSLRRFGQVRPVLADEGTMVAGHHLRYAARDLGWTHIAVFPHSFESETDRLAYLVADNHLAGLAGYDEQAQMNLFTELAEAGALEGTGVTIDFMEDLQARIGVPTTDYAGEWQGGYSEDAEAAAARAASLAASQAMKEIVLMVTPEQYEEFGRYVRALQQGYGTSGVVATVLRAVGEAAVALESTGGPAESHAPGQEGEPSPPPPAETLAGDSAHPAEAAVAAAEPFDPTGSASPAVHDIVIGYGNFEGPDDDTAYAAVVLCSCGESWPAIHGQEAEQLKNAHLEAVSAPAVAS